MGGDGAGHVEGQAAAQPGTAMGAEDDEACVLILGSIHDRLPGGRSRDRHALSAESRRLGQRGPVRGGSFSGLADLVAARGVEPQPRFRCELDAQRSPHGQDQRVALGRQLAPGLRYHGLGKVRAVAAEQHGPDPRSR
jgi:hypothetical protein